MEPVKTMKRITHKNATLKNASSQYLPSLKSGCQELTDLGMRTDRPSLRDQTLKAFRP